MADEPYDVVVVGAGPGGYVAGIRAGQLGLRAAVVDRGQWGGTCLHWGCIPSKALIRASRLVRDIREASRYGIRVGAPEIDLQALMAWKDGVVRRLSAGVRGLLKSNGVEAIVGEAAIEGPGRVRVTAGEGGGERLLETRAIVIATGVRPIDLPVLPFDGKRVVSAREALSLPSVPPRLLVVGGGPIGLELGGVWAHLGSRVTIVEMMPRILPGTDPDVVQVVHRRLRARGIEVSTGSRVVGADVSGAVLRVEVESGEGVRTAVEADVALVAVGMRPGAGVPGLERLGVSRDDRGFIRVDGRLGAGAPGVFAIGDVTGPPLLAHRASRQGEVAAEVIAGRPSEYDPVAVPAAVYCEPEVAGVGLDEGRAARDGIEVKVGRFPFAALGRAVIGGDTDGFVKVIAGAGDGRVLGVQIVGPEASDLIGEAALAIEAGSTAEDVALTIHAHPTHAESLMEAAKAVFGHAVHLPGGAK